MTTTLDLDTLKKRVDLAQVMRDHGLSLRKVGKNLVVRCPWHDDHEASLVVNPSKQLFNCFGCEAGGDVLNFLQLHLGVEFPQAVEQLRELAGNEPRPEQQKRPETTHQRDEILGRVAEIYARRLLDSQPAQDYLAARGLGDVGLWETFGLGFCDGSLLKMLPEEGGVRQALTEFGLLNGRGREHFLGCVVVPLSHPDEGVVGFYGRKLDPTEKVRHQKLDGPCDSDRFLGVNANPKTTLWRPKRALKEQVLFGPAPRH